MSIDLINQPLSRMTSKAVRYLAMKTSLVHATLQVASLPKGRLVADGGDRRVRLHLVRRQSLHWNQMLPFTAHSGLTISNGTCSAGPTACGIVCAQVCVGEKHLCHAAARRIFHTLTVVQLCRLDLWPNLPQGRWETLFRSPIDRRSE